MKIYQRFIKHVRNFAIKSSLFKISKALDKSTKTDPPKLLLSKLFFQLLKAQTVGKTLTGL